MLCAAPWLAAEHLPRVCRRQGSRSRAIHNRVNHRGRSTLFPLPAAGGQTSHFTGVARACAAGGTEPRVAVGGRRRGRGSAPDPARHPACRESEPGFSERMPGSAQVYRKFPIFSAESIVLLVGGAASAQLTGGYGSSPALPPAPPLPGLGEDPAPEDLSPRTEPARALNQSARDRLYAQSPRTV